MSTIKSSDEHLTLNADGSSKDIKFQANGVEKASISSSGAFTSTTIDATKLTGALPAISGAALTGVGVAGISSSADATAITIDSSENVGFGVTPETDWYPKVIQSGNRGAVYGYSNQTHLSNNAKMIDVSENYKYMESSYATDYSQEGGTHQFKVAPSGSADAAITWTTALEITNGGVLNQSSSQAIQAGVNTYMFTGSVNTSTSSFYVDCTIGNSGGGNVALVEAIFSHHGLSSYGCALMAWYAAYNGTLISENAISDIGTPTGGTWSCSTPTAGTLRVTKNAGNYAGGGEWFVKVTSQVR
jgi:hypothetical protein